jgi:DNA-binding response OmpR family regulator
MRVAVVDDDPRIRALLADELEDAGCTVLRCGGAAALLAAAELAQIELVLLDLAMPEMDGIRCVRELRSRGYAGRVLIVTALCDPAQRLEALAAGANDYLLKTDLLAGVDQLLGA